MSMRLEPEFYALVDEANAGDAYLATLAALYDPVVANDERRLRRIESDPLKLIDVATSGSSLEEVLARHGPSCHRDGSTRIPILTKPQNFLEDIILTIERVRDGEGGQSRLLSVNKSDIMPRDFIVAQSRSDLSVPVRAAILGRTGQELMNQVFLAMCAPDAHSRVKMGVYNMLDKVYGFDMNALGTYGWHAALKMAATYHGNHEVARDLAFSWLHLHDGLAIDSVVHLSLDELITRVESAPRGTSIGISSRTEHVVMHGLDELNAYTLDFDQRTPLNCVGQRPLYPEDHELTREQVLATLQPPRETLIQALEAAAAPDDEWREAEKQALDVHPAPKEGEPWEWLRLDYIEERNFLEQHAPYHVRRLHNGGVMLATYPYRYLWPLWSTALDLLGIRPRTT